jgi:hypothetical protein
MPGAAKLPSDRSVGITFVVMLMLLTTWLAWTGRPGVWATVILGVTLLVISIAKPSLLRPANKAWMKFAHLLHRIISPLVLGLMFFVLITPYAVIMRLFRTDPLNRRFDRNVHSFWIDRNPPGPPAGSFTKQF